MAGRAAYQLDLVPRDSRSLVGSVRIAIDGATHIPTRVQVFARGATTPAFEVGFTSLSTATPDASVFGFTPPPGATVKEGTLPSMKGTGQLPKPMQGKMQNRMQGQMSGHLKGAPQVVGKGWTSVLVADPPGRPAGHRRVDKPDEPRPRCSRPCPRVSGAWGSGHLLRTALLSAVLTDDGRVAVGAVPPQPLYRALSAR